jgi:MFS family permease
MDETSQLRILESPVILAVIGIAAVALLYFLVLELRKIPARLSVLMAAAFIDMVGLLMIIPLLPFYAKRLGGEGVTLGSMHLGIGVITAILVSAFTVAQLLSAPMWGRFSDRFGRRPALLVALGASAVAYVVFAFATSLWLLFLSRIVQGAGGGTVGVIQAYVADSTEPQDRARSLGWLSAATNLGVALGPVLGAVALTVGERPLILGGRDFALGPAAPGVFAALLCLTNMVFAWRFLVESREVHPQHSVRQPGAARAAVLRVATHPAEPAPRLIWIYAIAIGAFQGVNAILALFLADRWGVTEKTIAYFFTYIGIISVVTRALLLGPMIDRFGEARLARIGLVLMSLGLATLPLAPNLALLALSVALMPLGTAFTFPCVTALLSRVIASHERGLYMGVQQTYGGLSRVVLPLVFGIAFDQLGHAVPMWISASLVAVALMLGMGMEQYARSR